ncbi:ATP-binding region ATPase domain protein [Gemmatirosa kalamazoonensis]|uniref:histidine kinase n=1 Tax=Gemmatirosa kalamazoonensis TaxID=861299 RepID=W0RB20_9BACT|nr:ATP-binding protein [Gemmatirosa kalamazoonensis]AHG87986.1 ATP-binding region ATPase domain protein [Gemmatirosa kalamazoonensis]
MVREALGACGFTVVLTDPGTRTVERLYSEGTGAAVAGAVDAATFWETAGGRAVRDGEPSFVDGTLPESPSTGDRRIADRLRGTPARALAILPLVADETRGVLSLQFAERHAFDEPERRLLADFAAHVAVAVRNATLLVARERERDRAAAAAEIARVALDASSLDAGAAAILGVLDRLVPSAGKALSVLRDQGAGAAYVECAAAVGTITFLRGLRSATSARAARRASDARVRPVIVDDLRTVLTPERCPDATGQPGTAAAAVMVPLVARGRTLGDLAVTTPLGIPLAEAARDTLAQLAAPIALALDALLLGEERRRRLVEERQMTEQLRQAEKMAALGELVAGVAHEINNPLTGISAFAELLADDVLTDDQRESVRLIKREADRVVGVVRDLLVFSRKTEPAYAELDLNELVERTLRLRSYALRAAGIDVRLALDPSLPVVYGDEAKLQQVILNVVLNAEHAMRETPLRRIEAATRHTGDRVVLSLTDTGTGIAPDVLPRIFEPFFTTKPAGEGTGLGLSVSYGIVQTHGGELRVESTPGLGTTLEMVLPTHPAGVPAIDAALSSSAS